MINTSVKETLCARCAHYEVCIYMQYYIDVLKSIENVIATKNTSKEASRYAFISEIHVGCKYHENRT